MSATPATIHVNVCDAVGRRAAVRNAHFRGRRPTLQALRELVPRSVLVNIWMACRPLTSGKGWCRPTCWEGWRMGEEVSGAPDQIPVGPPKGYVVIHWVT
jgi:hypothetical protein